MIRKILFLAAICFSFVYTLQGQTITGSMSGGSAGPTGIDTEHTRDTVLQVGNTLAIDPAIGFLPVHYNETTKLWEPAHLTTSENSHDAILVEKIGDELILQKSGSFHLPSTNTLVDGAYYKLRKDSTINVIPDSILYSPVGHVHNDSIFTISPFIVFETGAASGGGTTSPTALDTDWLDQATGAVPTDINSNVYTFGDVGIGTSAQEFFGLTIERSLPQFIKLKNPLLNSGFINFNGNTIDWNIGFGIFGTFDISNNVSGVPIRIDSNASNFSLNLKAGSIRAGDYISSRNDMPISAQYTGSTGDRVPSNYMYTTASGNLSLVPIGSYPLQPYATSDTLSGRLDYTVTTTEDQVLPAGFAGKTFLIKNTDPVDPITLYTIPPELIDGQTSVSILPGKTRRVQSEGSRWETIIYSDSENLKPIRIEFPVASRTSVLSVADSGSFETISDVLDGGTIVYVEAQFGIAGTGTGNIIIELRKNAGIAHTMNVPVSSLQQTDDVSIPLSLNDQLYVHVANVPASAQSGLELVIGVVY